MKKKKPVFRIGYLCFFSLYVIFWVFIIFYVRSCLDKYEAAQPERVVEELVERLQTQGPGDIFEVKDSGSRFESVSTAAAYYAEGISGRTITWKQNKARYDVSAPSYQIFADEELIGEITLREVSSEPLMIILSLTEWEVAEARPVCAAGEESVSVTVPSTYSVKVNGEAVTDDEFTGVTITPEQFKYSMEYVDVPLLVEYSVQGLLYKPEVEIFDETGRAVEYTADYANKETRIMVDSFPASKMDPELEAKVLANAERYTNFFSGDLPGCSASVRPIADMFPSDSYYLTLADTYRREDMWMYSAHSTPSFANESVTNYVRYSDDLFSCDVYFDKNIHLTRTGETRIDTTNTRFFYGLLDGEWKILDMQTLLD